MMNFSEINMSHSENLLKKKQSVMKVKIFPPT